MKKVNFFGRKLRPKINIETRGGKYKNARVFMEQGITMLTFL